MALEKIIKEDKIEIVGDYKILQIRKATVIKEDGVEISSSFHRHTVAPDADISGESTEVQAVANAVWTDTVKAEYKTFTEAQTTL
tara:strand:- start:46 stop:300 length:255 start_codon:yes stop_codon:yes gene_type:complete